MLGISENVGGGALLQQLAVCHEEDPAAHLPGKAHLVGDHHHSHALLGQLLHDLQHLAHHLRVQGGGGLVKAEGIKKLDEVKDGDKVAVPNDSTNEARALKLLAKQGLIEVKDGELITVKDITKNPKNLKFVEVDAAQVPSTLDDVAIAVINTNYALNVGLNPTKDALVIESSDSPYVNIVAIRTEEKDSDKIKALTKALNSDEVKKFIEEKYNGSIVPAF